MATKSNNPPSIQISNSSQEGNSFKYFASYFFINLVQYFPHEGIIRTSKCGKCTVNTLYGEREREREREKERERGSFLFTEKPDHWPWTWNGLRQGNIRILSGHLATSDSNQFILTPGPALTSCPNSWFLAAQASDLHLSTQLVPASVCTLSHHHRVFPTPGRHLTPLWDLSELRIQSSNTKPRLSPDSDPLRIRPSPISERKSSLASFWNKELGVPDMIQ